MAAFAGPGMLDADAGAREERLPLGLGEPESRTVADRSPEGGSAPAGLQGHGAVAPGWGDAREFVEKYGPLLAGHADHRACAAVLAVPNAHQAVGMVEVDLDALSRRAAPASKPRKRRNSSEYRVL